MSILDWLEHLECTTCTWLKLDHDLCIDANKYVCW